MRNRHAIYGSVVVALLLLGYYHHARTISTLVLQDERDVLEQARLDRLRDFDPFIAAREVKAPERLLSGSPTLETSPDKYKARLLTFASKYFPNATRRADLERDLDSTLSGISLLADPGSSELPHRLWSTSPDGRCSETFELWESLLQRAPKVFKDEIRWVVEILDDKAVDSRIYDWSGEAFLTVWRQLKFGVLRADVFRYMCMLWEGGIYGDTDTGPITHPYYWGNGAHSLLSRRQTDVIKAERIDYQPPYFRGPPSPSIASSKINMVVGIEWDSAIANSWKNIMRWDLGRLRRVKQDAYPRRLQFVQYLLVVSRFKGRLTKSKPHHPVFLDTIATIAELVESGQHLGALDLTGPGPFTDAVLRYLLVQYGVTPASLRSLSGPVQVGDIIILQEEAMLAPHSAMTKVLRYKDWIWDRGYSSWRNGRQIAFHGLAGSWKGLGWN